MKSGNLNLLEPSGPLQACNETALPLPLRIKTDLLLLLSARIWQPQKKSFAALVLGKAGPDTNKLGNVRMW